MPHRVLVTGCSSGIGRALAVELARRGHAVVATARDLSALDGLDLERKLALDVTDSASVAACVAAAGPVDVLVNNAGVTVWGPVEAPNEAEVQRLFETNLFGTLRMIRAVLPGMRRRGRGAVFQVSSAAARRPSPLLGHYAATKAALEAYSEALRMEVKASGIDVCIVSLGAVESRFGVNRREVNTGDYVALVAGTKARIAQSRKAPVSAEDVAARIADAIEAGNPPLRIDGGGDAFALIAERAAVSDAEWEERTLAGIAAAGG